MAWRRLVWFVHAVNVLSGWYMCLSICFEWRPPVATGRVNGGVDGQPKRDAGHDARSTMNCVNHAVYGCQRGYLHSINFAIEVEIGSLLKKVVVAANIWPVIRSCDCTRSQNDQNQKTVGFHQQK